MGERQYGKNKVKCLRYRNEGRREKNKLKKLRKVLKHQPNNLQIANQITSQINSLNKNSNL